MSEDPKPIGIKEDATHVQVIRARSCNLCSGLGYFRATNLSDGDQYAFLCSCSAGHNCGKRFPLWTRSLETKYIPDWKSENMFGSTKK